MDIQKAVMELVALGYSETRIARELSLEGVRQPTINRIKNGKTKNPGYELGNAIVELHARAIGASGKAA